MRLQFLDTQAIIPETLQPPMNSQSHSNSQFSSNTQKKDLILPATTKAPLLTYPKSDLNKPKPITAAQREERRAKGLCYYCDDKFTLGHQCKNPRSFMIVGEDQVEEDYEEPPKFDEEPCEHSETAPPLMEDKNMAVFACY